MRLLAGDLRVNGFDVLTTLQPGGTPLGRRLREAFLETEENVHPMAELLLFAADRENRLVAHRFDPLSAPSLRALRLIAERAAAAGCSVTVCGEIAGRPLEAMALIGLGFRRLSLAPAAVGPVKAMILKTEAGRVAALVNEALADAAAASTLRPALRAFAERHGARAAYAKLSDLLGDSRVDGVFVCSPNALHAAHVIQAAQAGKHVLCEKPIGVSVEEVESLADAVKASGKVLQVAYMKRHDPAYKRALELLPADIVDVKLISVEVNDPDFEPFTAHLPMTLPKDIPADLRSQARAATAAQLRESAGDELDTVGTQALGGGYL